MKILTIRPVEESDSELLLYWRNDLSSREASRDTAEVSLESHSRWFSQVQSDPDCHVLIAEADGVPVGSVRIEIRDEAAELSWIVDPETRGSGVGKHMVAIAARQVTRPIYADIKSTNRASARIAEFAGLSLNSKPSSELMRWFRPARPLGSRFVWVYVLMNHSSACEVDDGEKQFSQELDAFRRRLQAYGNHFVEQNGAGDRAKTEFDVRKVNSHKIPINLLLVVTNNSASIEAGKKFGASVCAITQGDFDESLHQLGADWVVDSFQGVLEVLADNCYSDVFSSQLGLSSFNQADFFHEI